MQPRVYVCVCAPFWLLDLGTGPTCLKARSSASRGKAEPVGWLFGVNVGYCSPGKPDTRYTEGSDLLRPRASLAHVSAYFVCVCSLYRCATLIATPVTGGVYHDGMDTIVVGIQNRSSMRRYDTAATEHIHGERVETIYTVSAMHRILAK